MLPRRVIKMTSPALKQPLVCPGSGVPGEPHSPLKSCVGSWGQRARHKGKASETRLRGRGFGQAGEKSGANAAAFLLSAFPRQQKKQTPPRAAHQAAGEERCPLAPSALAPRSSPREGYAGVSREFPSLQSLWLSWKGVGFKRLILGDFIHGAKRKEIARPDGARDAHGLGKSAICANHH